MIRAVLDTNVLVSALLAPMGNEAQVVEAVQQRKFIPCFSTEILDEYVEVLSRSKFGFPQIDVDDAVGLIRANGLIFAPQPMTGSSPDPEDDALIACAFAAQADYLVTGNRRHFPQESCGLTKVVSARELLDALKTRRFP